jgi:diguanylate cyclase (GGDEF)-like protein
MVGAGRRVATRAKTGRQQAIADVVAALASSPDAHEALTRAAEAVGGAEGASLVQIWAGATADELVCRASWSDSEAKAADVVTDPAGRTDLHAVLNGTDLVEWRAGQNASGEAAALLDACRATRLVTLAARVDGHAAGALTVAQRGPSTKPTAAERKRLATLAQLLASPLRAAGAHETDESAARQITALRAAGRAVACLQESDQAVDAVKEQVAALVGGTDCRVRVLLRTDSGTFTEFPPRGAEDGQGGLEFEGTTDIEERALVERRTVTAVTPGAVRLATPLLLRGAPLGFLTLISGRNAPFSPAEILTVESLAQQVCLVLDMARLRRAVQRLTTIDTLTGLRNREFLFERLAAEVARARRYREPLSLVLLDVDDFAQFNAKHGNREGNRLLRTAANLVRTSIRANVDVACRFGGGEFALLLPNTLAAARGAGVVAERIRRTIEGTQFRDDYDNRLSRVTVSLGIAGFPVHAEDGEDLIGLACEALQAAKKAGKNRVGLYSLQR